GVGTIKGRIFERHRKSATLPEFHCMVQLRPAGQIPCDRYKLFREIDSGDCASVLSSKVASWATNPAPHIKEAETRTQLHLSSEFFCRFAATDMKFVQGRKVIMRQVCQV